MTADTVYRPAQFVVLDPSLMTDSGHHLPAASDVVQQCQSLGIKCNVFCNAAADDTVKNLPAIPMFRNHAYLLNEIEDADEEYAAVITYNNAVLYDLFQVNREPLKPDTFIFFPVVTYNHVIGICQWIASFPPKTSPKFGLGFTFQLNWNTDGTVGRPKDYVFQMAFDLLKDSQKKNVVCTCETPSLGDDYKRVTGMDQVIAPIPTITQRLIEQGDAQTDGSPIFAKNPERVTIGLIGSARPEKGVDLWPKIIEQVNGACANVDFAVHLTPSRHPTLTELRSMAESGHELHIVDGFLDAKTYVEFLSQCDVIALTYNPETYIKRGSALFTEAGLLGISLVVPAGTWMSKLTEEYGTGVAFSEFTPAEISKSMVSAVNQIDALRRQAKTHASHAHTQSYVEKLFHCVSQ